MIVCLYKYMQAESLSNFEEELLDDISEVEVNIDSFTPPLPGDTLILETLRFLCLNEWNISLVAICAVI